MIFSLCVGNKTIEYVNRMKTHTSYIVCATPRSGSGLLCDTLWRTGLAGKPDEYFLPENVVKNSMIWQVSTLYEYFYKVIEKGTTPNGIFGSKIMWDHVNYFRIQVFRKDHRLIQRRTSDLLDSLFPNLHYIWIKRRDKVRQAVSFYKSLKTGIYNWREDNSPQYIEIPQFNFKAIDGLINKIRRHDTSWQNYFEKLRISPLIVTYEDHLEFGYEEVIKRILNYLGVKIPDGLTIKSEYRKQSDKLSEKFVYLYHDALQHKKEKSL